MDAQSRVDSLRSLIINTLAASSQSIPGMDLPTPLPDEITARREEVIIDSYGDTLEKILYYTGDIDPDLFVRAVERGISKHAYSSTPGELLVMPRSLSNGRVTTLILRLHPSLGINFEAAIHWIVDYGSSARRMEDLWMKTREAITFGNAEFVRYVLPLISSYDDDGTLHPFGNFLVDEYVRSSNDQIEKLILDELIKRRSSILFDTGEYISTGIPRIEGPPVDIPSLEQHLTLIGKLSAELPGWSRDELVDFAKKFNTTWHSHGYQTTKEMASSGLMTARFSIKATGNTETIRSRIIRILELDAQSTSQKLGKSIKRWRMLTLVAVS